MGSSLKEFSRQATGAAPESAGFPGLKVYEFIIPYEKTKSWNISMYLGRQGFSIKAA
jgi:hypothetical protein